MHRFKKLKIEEIRASQILTNYTRENFFFVQEVGKDLIWFRREDKSEGSILKEEIAEVEALDFTVLTEKKLWLAERGEKYQTKESREVSYIKQDYNIKSEEVTKILMRETEERILEQHLWRKKASQD